ncbi:tetratricopeptide repeat protein, partial [candidate division TA06 bacterium]|nr:tetratricopeptide repeat protein [candidate division TA06 bacterium]
FKKGQLGEAIEWFQKTLELDPGHVGGHYNLAKAYLRIGESEKGAKEFETFEVLSGYQDEIEAFLSGVVESYPPSKEIQIRLGKLYLKALKYPKVIEALKLAITLGSAENDTLFYTLALAYYQLGKNELAIQALQKTLEINPSHLEARFNLVLVYRLQGKGKEAAEEEGIYNRLKKKKSK